MRGSQEGGPTRRIRFICTSPDIFSYWQQRYNWTLSQTASIDIAGTRAAISKLCPATNRRIQKLRCGWLPVNSRESRIDPDRLPGCSACSPSGILVETVDHIFQCPSQSRRHLILSRFAEFSTELRKLKTSRCIIDAISIGALAWVTGQPVPSIEDLHLPQSEIGRLTSIAFYEQSQLGWNTLFRGFIPKSWRLAQEAQFLLYHIRDPQDTGERWSCKLQLWFIHLFESLWGLRNELEHGADIDTQALIRTSKCERAIRRLFSKSLDLPPEEQHPFRSTLEDLLSQSVADQELWITLTEAFLVNVFRRARSRRKNRQPAITKFFARLQP